MTFQTTYLVDITKGLKLTESPRWHEGAYGFSTFMTNA